MCSQKKKKKTHNFSPLKKKHLQLCSEAEAEALPPVGWRGGQELWRRGMASVEPRLPSPTRDTRLPPLGGHFGSICGGHGRQVKRIGKSNSKDPGRFVTKMKQMVLFS